MYIIVGSIDFYRIPSAMYIIWNIYFYLIPSAMYNIICDIDFYPICSLM